ncbi:hypothetical protein NDU88_004926 [Pleurodeles waltl]|uniref:Uncharacterized protein n=1 Tax=Pleurodeles waltl TaxID=8319 RepID=A0AAV7TSX1_PLEWA|nr:hypothetical protein NDU88_004926 [Pleurodeles waltl]
MQSSPQPSPDRRLTETRGGSSTPPGLGASNSSSALLEPGTYGPKQGSEIPGSPCCHPRTEKTGAPERLSLKPSPPSGRIWDEGLYLIAPRCSTASGAFPGQMDRGCVRMSDHGRIPDVRLLQVRTLPHASSGAIRSSGRRRRPGSPSGALLPSSQETGLSVGSAAPLVAGDRALHRERCSPRRRRPGSPSGALLPSPQETGALCRERCSPRRRRPGSPLGALLPSSQESGFSDGSAAPLFAGDRALRRERCSPRRRRPGSPPGALRLRRTTVKGKIGIYTKE